MTASVLAPTGEATQGNAAAIYCSSLKAHLPRAHASSVSGMTPICAVASDLASVAELHAIRSILTSPQSGNREQMTLNRSVGYRPVRRANAGRIISRYTRFSGLPIQTMVGG